MDHSSKKEHGKTQNLISRQGQTCGYLEGHVIFGALEPREKLEKELELRSNVIVFAFQRDCFGGSEEKVMPPFGEQ